MNKLSCIIFLFSFIFCVNNFAFAKNSFCTINTDGNQPGAFRNPDIYKALSEKYEIDNDGMSTYALRITGSCSSFDGPCAAYLDVIDARTGEIVDQADGSSVEYKDAVAEAAKNLQSCL